MDRSGVISQMISLTNCSDSEAAFYLEAANYDLDRAVAMFYGGLPLRKCTVFLCRRASLAHSFQLSYTCTLRVGFDCLPDHLAHQVSYVQIKPLRLCSIEQLLLPFISFLRLLHPLSLLYKGHDDSVAASCKDWFSFHWRH